MSTMGHIIDRTFRTYLRPPDQQEAICYSASALTAVSTDTSLTISQFAVPEDEQLLYIGTLLELGSELVRVETYDPIFRLVTVKRADEGTTLAAHDSGTKIIMRPTFSRASVFEAVADNIISLHPALYTVNQELVSAIGPGIAPISDVLAISPITVWDETWSNVVNHHAEIVDYHPVAGGRALVCNSGLSSMWVRYKRRMGTPTAETDTLEDLGVDPRWVNVIMVGAAADLLVGQDISAVHTDFISQAFEAETVRPGTRTTIGARLAGYRDLLLKRFKDEMNTEYGVQVRMRDWTNEVV